MKYLNHLFKTAYENSTQFFYKLPKEEILGKSIAISFYLGYIHLQNNKLWISEKGFPFYHGILVLFYSKNVQNYVLEDLKI